MQIHAPKQSKPQQKASAHYSRLTHGNAADNAWLHQNDQGRMVAAGLSAHTGFAHDFSRIPVRAKAPENLQAKLTINTPGDIYEQEADRVAAHVMHMPDPQLQRACACGGGCHQCQTEQLMSVDPLLPPPVQRATIDSAEAPLDLLEAPIGDHQARALGATAQPPLIMSSRATSMNLLQRDPQSSDDQGDCSGWERDCESFCHSVAKQYWVDIDGVQPPLVNAIECSKPTFGRAMCIVTFNGGLVVSIATTSRGKTLEVWRTRTGKSDHAYEGPECKYTYHCTAKDNSLVLERTSCTEHQLQPPKQEQEQEQEQPHKSQTLQRHSTYQSDISKPPPIVYQALNAPGRPLDNATTAFMESRFVHDFSQVRVHSDSIASAAADAVNAKAFTVRNAIVFGAGRYSPASSEGRRLLAHELTHVVQQQAAPWSGLRRLPSSPPVHAAQRFSDRLFRKEEKTVFEKEGITDKRIVDDTPEVRRIVLATLSNPHSRLFPYIEDKLKNLKEGKTKYDIEDPDVFASKYRAHAKRRHKEIDPTVKDADLVRDIGGFYEPRLNTVFLKTRSNYCDAFHETIHSFSSPDYLIQTVGKDLMEGLTQYFTDEIFREQLLDVCHTHNYGVELSCATKLVDKAGFDLVASVFFLTNVGKQEEIARKLGLKDSKELRQLGSEGICRTVARSNR